MNGAELNMGSISNNNNNRFTGARPKDRKRGSYKLLIGFVTLLFLVVLMKNCLGTSLNSSTNSSEYFQNINSFCLTKECLRAASDLMYDMDISIDPCDDFYQFACGNWAENHPIPDTDDYFDWSFERQTLVDRSIRHILISNGKPSEPDAVKKARTMYKACMNTTHIRQIDYQAIIDLLIETNLPIIPSMISKNISSTLNESSIDDFDWIKTVATIRKNLGLDVIVGFDIIPGREDKTKNHITFCILNHRLLKEYFKSKDDEEKASNDTKKASNDTTDEEKNIRLMNRITGAISNFTTFANPDFRFESANFTIRMAAKRILEITNLLNKFIREGIEMVGEDANKGENTQDLESFDDFQILTDKLITPNSIPIWYKYSDIMFQDISPKIDLNSSQILSDRGGLHYLQKVTKFIDETPTIDLELFIWWDTVYALARLNVAEMPSYTSEDEDATIERSLECTRKVHESMLMAVSYAMAKPNFINETKPKIVNMIENIRLAFDESVKNNTWIDSKTKQLIWEKSKEMKAFVGLPKWIAGQDKLDEFYAGIHFDAKSHIRNLMNLIRRRVNRLLKTINDPESNEWTKQPTDVNAFYFMPHNAITIPLAFLQYPFYNLGLDSLDYGAMGYTIGHELTHGFDGNGRMYDKHGKKRKWWKNVMITEFKNRAKCFVEQYSKFHVTELNKSVDGELTLSENIADNGGLRQAFYAYKLHSNKYGKEQKLPGLENFTHEQLFFISFGHIYCEAQTAIAMKKLLTLKHAPNRFRVNGALANSEEFRSAFSCSADSKMVSKNKCSIW